MNDSEEKLSYRLFKKGRENYGDFDKLIIESNDLIKERLNKLSGVNPDICQKISKQTEEKTALRKRRAARNRLFFRIATIPAAACFLFFFTFIYKSITAPISLGGSVYLFVSPADRPDTFYTNGTGFTGGEEVTLAFQPDAELDNIQQGVLFSIDSNLESIVYYRYDKQSDPLIENNPTQIGQTVRLENNTSYIYFFIILSTTSFNETGQIEKIKQIIKEKQLKSDAALTKELKNKAASYIYLQRKP